MIKESGEKSEVAGGVAKRGAGANLRHLAGAVRGRRERACRRSNARASTATELAHENTRMDTQRYRPG